MNENQTWTCWRDPSHETKPHPWYRWPRCTVCGAAPAYHERPGYLPAEFWLPVYVLAPAARARVIVAPGSGIVGGPVDTGERTTVHYEGWVHGAAQYASRDAPGRWEAGVEHAAGRMITEYPTSAAASIPTEDLLMVANYNPTTRAFGVFDDESLAAWLETTA